MNETKRKFNWVTDTPLWLIVVLYLVFGAIASVGVMAFILYCIHYAKS